MSRMRTPFRAWNRTAQTSSRSSSTKSGWSNRVKALFSVECPLQRALEITPMWANR